MATPLWTPAQLHQRQARARNRSIFQGCHEYVLLDQKSRRVKRTYVTYNVLGDIMTRKIAELVFPSLPTLTVEGTTEQQAAVDRLIEVLQLDDICQQTALTVSYASDAWWKVGWDGESVTVVLWGNNGNEFATVEGSPRHPQAVVFWYFVGEGDKAVAISERHSLGMTYTFAEDGTPLTSTGEGLIIESQAWKTDGQAPVNVPVAWEAVPWPMGYAVPPQRIDLPGLTTLPVAHITNLDLDGDGDPDSDYTPSLISIQQNINKLLSIRQAVVDYCEFPAIQMSEVLLDDEAESAEVVFDDAKFSIEPEDGRELSKKAKIRIEGWTGNLENSGKQLDYYIDAFHKLSGISKALFGEELSGNDSGYARRLALMGLQKGIEARRARYAHAFVTVLRAAMEIERLFGLATVEPIERLTIEWASVVPSDTASEEQRVVQQAQSGVRSLRSSVKLLNPLFTDEEITAEVNCIIDEQAAIRRVAVMMPDGASSE